MKQMIRVLSCLLVLLSVLAVGVSVSAETAANRYTYELDGVEYTVEFIETTLSAEGQEAVAQRLIGGEDSTVQPYGLVCTIFGHDLSTSSVGVITHKIRTYAPRCRHDIYLVDTCSRCDYQTQTLKNTGYLDCCPED